MTITVGPGAGPQSVTRPPEATERALAAVEDALATLASLDPDDAARRPIRDKIIHDCLPLARREAARYRHSGECMDDLLQVATLGLIQAVDRFQPGRGVPFRHFATPTITGELKRHFRDKGWSVRVSRRVQELHQVISRAEPDLAQRLRRSPTVADLANHLRISENDVRAGIHGAAAYRARSLNYRVGGDDVTELGDLLGGDDRDLEAVADVEALRTSLRLLPPRLQHVLALRFVENLTQVQIAEQIGVSQMHVSRLIGRALAMLRAMLLSDEPARAEQPAGETDDGAAVTRPVAGRPTLSRPTISRRGANHRADRTSVLSGNSGGRRAA
jgi:RNA polymerase sigma-B factor